MKESNKQTAAKVVKAPAAKQVQYSSFDPRLWLQKWRASPVHWKIAIFECGTPLIALYGLLTTTWVLKTWIVCIITWYIAQVGLTASYHRLYSHRSFAVTRPAELLLLLMATSAFSMSAIDWVRDHRAHHKYLDEGDKDPYNIKKGFFWAHFGWLLWKREKPNSDISDLTRDPVLCFQHKWLYFFTVTFAWLVPMWICGHFWGDYRGGFYIAGMFKTVFVQHCLFSINSVAHYFGDANFSDEITPRDSALCAFFTMGEGYHNYHHEFPSDYRHGTHYTAIDATKWLIATMEFFGLAYDLQRIPDEKIRLSKIQMVQKKLKEEKSHIFTGIPKEKLPFLTPDQIQELNKQGSNMVIIKDIVYDVKDFVAKHPGGSGILESHKGRDVTQAISGGVYRHSKAARNIMKTFRCGRIAKKHA